jgi:hypothetical protein
MQPVEPYFHVCCIVADLDEAMEELSGALGLSWLVTRDRKSGDKRWRVVYSAEGPPFVELVEGSPGTPWHVTDGSRLHHMGRFTDDLEAGIAGLESAGGHVEVDGRDISGRWVYVRLPVSGALVELIEADERGRQEFMARIGLSAEQA